MVTSKLQIDEAANATAEFDQYLESQVPEIAPDTSFDYIHPAFRAFAQKTKNEIERGLRQKLENTLDIGRKLLEAKQVLTRRKEYSRFRESLELSAADARNCIKLFEMFGDWEISRLLTLSSATNLFALCQAKYAEVVSQLREVPQITKEFVKQRMKEARAVHAPKKTKTQAQDCGNPVLSKHVDEETGNFYYTLKEVNLSYATGSALADRLETQTIGQVLAEAVEVRDDYVTNQLQELQAVVADVQRLSVENRELKFQLEERDGRIAQLESQLLSFVPQKKNNDEKTGSMHFSTWSEVATALSCDRSKLLLTVKNWSTSERQKLSKLLSEFLETEKEGLEQAAWIPENLLLAALRYLFFTVQRVIGSNNLMDDPHVEHVEGCRLVSLRDFGTKREHWIFQSPDGKQFPVYCRSEFSIEQF